MDAALEEVLELWRGKDAHVDEGHPLRREEFTLRRSSGGVRSAIFPWSDELARNLEDAVHGREGPRDHAREHVGRMLSDFFSALGWDEAAGAGRAAAREVRITIRCRAGELCRLPLELLKLKPSGLPLGMKDGWHVQWEWPETETAPRVFPASAEGGALMLAWSGAGGTLNAGELSAGIARAVKRHGHPGTVETVAHAGLAGMKQALEAARSRQEPVAVLQVLCHGGRLPGVEGGYGLWLHGPDGNAALVAPGAFAQALEPYAGLVGCVVLSACDGANLAGDGNFLGSVAQGLHRAGFPAVVASRAPLSQAGARAFSETFYDALLGGDPLHRAVAAGRRDLGDDWLGLQLYARAKDGPLYPMTFRPYRGLQAFEEKDRRFFFGRERPAAELLGRVVEAWRGGRPRFQLVAGTSGSGKSSLVKAGVVPELRKGGWRIAIMRPGGDEGARKGLARLAQALSEMGGEPVAAGEAEVMAEARRLREQWPDAPALLVVDQMEEAFKLEGEEPQTFLACLWRLARDESLKVVVLGTFRMDLLEQAEDVVLEEGVTLQTAVYEEAQRFFVRGMSGTELLDAIRRPVEAVGLRFEAGVAEQLRDDAGKEPGALPLLEHAMDAVWQARADGVLARAAYEGMGGLAGALSQQLDLLWERLPEEQQRQGHRLLVALVDFADEVGLSTRRRRAVEELRPEDGQAAASFHTVLEWLVARRLLVRGKPEEGVAGGEWVEIAHEALIRRWARLQGWLREHHADEMQLRELEGVAAEWGKRFDDSYLPAGGKLKAFEQLEHRVGHLPPGPARCLKAARSRRLRDRNTTVAMVTVVILMVLGIAVSVVIDAREGVESNAQELALERVRQISSRSEAPLADSARAVGSLARLYAFLQLPMGEQQMLIRNLLIDQREVNIVTVFDGNGRRIPQLQAFDVPLPDVAVHQRVAEELLRTGVHERRSSSPYLSSRGTAVTTLALPLGGSEDKPSGYLAAEVSLERLNHVLDVPSGATWLVYLTDLQGRLLIGPRERLGDLKPGADLSTRPAVAHLLATLKLSPTGESLFVGNFGWGDGRVTSAYLANPRLGWAIVSEQPMGVVYAPADAAGRRIVLKVAQPVAVAMAVLLALVGIRKYRGPFRGRGAAGK